VIATVPFFSGGRRSSAVPWPQPVARGEGCSPTFRVLRCAGQGWKQCEGDSSERKSDGDSRDSPEWDRKKKCARHDAGPDRRGIGKRLAEGALAARCRRPARRLDDAPRSECELRLLTAEDAAGLVCCALDATSWLRRSSACSPRQGGDRPCHGRGFYYDFESAPTFARDLRRSSRRWRGRKEDLPVIRGSSAGRRPWTSSPRRRDLQG